MGGVLRSTEGAQGVMKAAGPGWL